MTAANTHLNFQLLNLTSTIQALQADLQLFESRVSGSWIQTHLMQRNFSCLLVQS